MKLLSKSILSAMVLQLSLIPTVALAQNSHECFMQDANGNPIDLGHLCGGSRNRANTSTIRTTNTVSNSTGFFIVPIKRRVHGTPVIDVKFNGRYTFEMLFDTGATMTVITEPMAKTLRIKPTGSLPFQTASNNMIFFEIGSVASASAGNMTSNNLDIAVAPTMDVGLLGQNFYGMYDITIKSETIEFRKR